MKISYCLSVIVLIFALNATVKVAVLELKDIEVGGGISTILTDNLVSELSKHENFEVLEREKINSIMEEQGLQESGLCDDQKCLVKVGGLLGAEKMVTGSIGRLGNIYSLSLRMFDVETAKNQNSVTLNRECKKEELIVLLKDAAYELTEGKSGSSESISAGEYNTKMRELKEYEKKVKELESEQEKKNIGKICKNVAATVAATCAAYNAQYGYTEKQLMEKLPGWKTKYGESLNFDGNELIIPTDYMVEVTLKNVIVSHKDGQSAEVRWR